MKIYKIKYEEFNKVKTLKIKTNNLKEENLPSDIISIKEVMDFNFLFSQTKIKTKDINLIFYELDLMLESGLNLNKSLEILIKNKKNQKIKEFLIEFKNSLISGASLTKVFKRYRLSPLIITFWELSIECGNITSNIKLLNTLLRERENIKDLFIKSIRYPIVLLISFFLSLFSIFYFVVPKFKDIFIDSLDKIPLATKILFDVNYFFENYFYHFILMNLFFLLFIVYLYITNSTFKYKINKGMFFIFYKDLELYKMFLIIDLMQKNNYEFHKALISSRIILTNEYLINELVLVSSLIENGKSINYSFFKVNIFDDLVLNLLSTGEISNSLILTINEIKKIYKNRFNKKIEYIVSLIEPIFLIIIMGLILWIILAVFIPIWDMGNIINT